MKQNNKYSLGRLTLAIASVVLIGTGCDAGNASDSEELSESLDVAESVAVIQGEETGGVMEAVADLAFFAQEGSMSELGKSQDDLYQRSYDATAGLWTITKQHSRGIEGGVRYASISRVFTIQFLNAAGDPQKFYNTNGSLASSIEKNLLEAEGVIETPRVSALRSGISGKLVATGTDTDTVTVNGNYARNGSQVITSLNAVRSLDFAADLEIIDLVGPRGSRRDLSQKYSGSIVGNYEATRVVERDNVTTEKQIDKTFTIEIVDGESTITVDGERFENDLTSGELG